MKKAFRAGESEGAAVVLPAVLPVSGAMLTVCNCWCSPGSPGIMFLSASSLSLGLSSKGQRPRCHLPAPASLCSKIICSPPRMALPCCKRLENRCRYFFLSNTHPIITNCPSPRKKASMYFSKMIAAEPEWDCMRLHSPPCAHLRHKLFAGSHISKALCTFAPCKEAGL